MARSKQQTRSTILAAVGQVLRRRGAHATTTDAVAREAKCAKGLVHYHFHTKQELLVEAVLQIADAREAAWVEAFDSPTPQDAIDRTWELVRAEADDGTLRAWTSLIALADEEVDRAVSSASKRFRERVTSATEALLRRTGRSPTIPADQLGWLLAAVVQGMAFHVAAGADLDVLQNAYAAAWLGVLSLTAEAP